MENIRYYLNYHHAVQLTETERDVRQKCEMMVAIGRIHQQDSAEKAREVARAQELKRRMRELETQYKKEVAVSEQMLAEAKQQKREAEEKRREAARLEAEVRRLEAEAATLEGEMQRMKL